MIAGIWWDYTRASANVAWVLILFTILWGVLLTTRVLRGMDRPAWLRDLHQWLGGLTVFFSLVHMLTLIPDKYVHFQWINLIVPFTNSYKPLAVSLGVLGFWTLLAIETTSLLMKKMSRETWRRIHMLSYPLYGIIVVHSLTAGSDVGSRLYTGFTVSLAMTGAAVGGIRLVTGRFIDRKKHDNAATGI